MEGLVYGWRIFQNIDEKLKKSNSGQKEILSDLNKLIERSNKDIRSSRLPEGRPMDIKTLILRLRSMMSQNVGILRNRAGLDLAGEFADFHIENKNLYNRKDKDAIEFANMLTVANLIIRAALIREESRGTHLRSDFPERDDKIWKKHIILKNDKVKFKKVR